MTPQDVVQGEVSNLQTRWNSLDYNLNQCRNQLFEVESLWKLYNSQKDSFDVWLTETEQDLDEMFKVQGKIGEQDKELLERLKV